jgi:hypothetical protein
MCRVINDFEKGYQPRTNTVKDEKVHLFADFHRILARWRNCFFQLLNVHGVKDVRQTEIHTVELAPEPSAFEVELSLKSYVQARTSHKSPGIGQIPAESIKAGGRRIGCVIPKYITSI